MPLKKRQREKVLETIFTTGGTAGVLSSFRAPSSTSLTHSVINSLIRCLIPVAILKFWLPLSPRPVAFNVSYKLSYQWRFSCSYVYRDTASNLIIPRGGVESVREQMAIYSLKGKWKTASACTCVVELCPRLLQMPSEVDAGKLLNNRVVVCWILNASNWLLFRNV